MLHRPGARGKGHPLLKLASPRLIPLNTAKHPPCDKKHSSKQHTAHCTRLCRSNRPACHRRTPGTVAACAKSCVYGGARGSQHPKCPGTSANWRLTSSQHMPGPLFHQQPLTSSHPARPALASEHATRPEPRQSARKRREDGDASFDPKWQLLLAEVHVAFTPHTKSCAPVNRSAAERPRARLHHSSSPIITPTTPDLTRSQNSHPRPSEPRPRPARTRHLRHPTPPPRPTSLQPHTPRVGSPPSQRE